MRAEGNELEVEVPAPENVIDDLLAVNVNAEDE